MDRHLYWRTGRQNFRMEGSTQPAGSIDSFMISGRVGFPANPSTLVYAKAGDNVIETSANPEFFTFDSGRPETLAAHQLGFGIETNLTEHVNLRLEGLYTAASEGLVVELAQEGQATLTPRW